MAIQNIDFGLKAGWLRLEDAQGLIAELCGGLTGRGKIGSEIEKVVLDTGEHGIEELVGACMQAGKTHELLSEVNMGNSVYSTPVVANGVLYIMTRSRIYAIAQK